MGTTHTTNNYRTIKPYYSTRVAVGLWTTLEQQLSSVSSKVLIIVYKHS